MDDEAVVASVLFEPDRTELGYGDPAPDIGDGWTRAEYGIEGISTNCDVYAPTVFIGSAADFRYPGSSEQVCDWAVQMARLVTDS